MSLERTWTRNQDNTAWVLCGETGGITTTSIVEDPANSGIYTYTSEDGTQTSWDTSPDPEITSVDENTDINIWYDTSSMSQDTQDQIVLMGTLFLKQSLLPFYGGDLGQLSTAQANVDAGTKYDARVRVLPVGEDNIKQVLRDNRGGRPSTSSGGDRSSPQYYVGTSGIINITFNDEESTHNGGYHNFFSGSGRFDPFATRKSNYNAAIAEYRGYIDDAVAAGYPNFYKTAWMPTEAIQNDRPVDGPEGTAANRRQHNNFIHSVTYGIGEYAGIYGASDYHAAGNWLLYTEVDDFGSAAYYNSVVLDILSQFK